MYGAGSDKIARILGCTSKEAKDAMAEFLKNTPALKKLKEDIAKVLKERKGFLKGLDGRPLYSRSAHSALNLICQSAGALVMKKALSLLDSRCQHMGWVPGKDYEFVVNVHDEWGAEVLPTHAKTFGLLSQQAIIDAGVHFKLNCPLDAKYKIGSNWKETH